MKPKLSVKIFLSILLAGALLGTAVMIYSKQEEKEAIAFQGKMVSMMQEVIKLSLLEVHLSQIYEFKKDSLKLLNIPIPLTDQKSLIMAEGKASLGYDLRATTISIGEDRRTIHVRLPDPSVLSLDLNYRFVFENDTFLNRITPEDRNETLEKIKQSVSLAILNESYKDNLRKRAEELSKSVSTKLGMKIIFD